MGTPAAGRGYLVQAAGMAAAAAAIFAGLPVAVCVSAVIACVAQTTVRPAQSALVPLVAATADQLTAVNVVVSWALRTLLQRSVPLELMTRAFGVLERLTMAGYALEVRLAFLPRLGNGMVNPIGPARLRSAEHAFAARGSTRGA